VKERTDGEILAGLIERSRLLIALSEEIPVETKLETQPLLKQLEQLVEGDAPTPDLDRIAATHTLLSDTLAEYPDLDALLGAMRHFLPR
jgi:hypothetical protein